MKKKVFKSKIGWWYYCLMLFVAVLFVLSFIPSELWLMSVATALVTFEVWETAFNTSYTLSGGTLKVRCGIFYRVDVKVESIRVITPTHTWLSSAALSMDRLRITYNKYDEVTVSPKRKAEFVEMLKKENPRIVVSKG